MNEDTQPECVETSPDFDKAFQSHPDPFSPKLTHSDSEQIRIDRAFKRQETHPINIKPKSYGDYEMKSSNSMQGITNPNYGISPTSSKTSLGDLQLGNLTPLEGQKIFTGNFKCLFVSFTNFFCLKINEENVYQNTLML